MNAIYIPLTCRKTMHILCVWVFVCVITADINQSQTGPDKHDVTIMSRDCVWTFARCVPSYNYCKCFHKYAFFHPQMPITATFNFSVVNYCFI